MKILITGSNGYVGNFLSQYLSKIHTVIGLDLISNKRQKNYTNYIFEPCNVLDRKRINAIFKKHKPTHILHLAYLMEPQHNRSFEDAIDVTGSINIFDSAVHYNAKKFIHFSSASVYGGYYDNHLWISEQQPPRPRDWVYAINKVKVENYFKKNQNKIQLINLRMCTAVGPKYYKKGSVVSTIARSPIGLLINGKDTLLQFIHEDDVTNLISLILNDKTIEGTFNLAPDSYAATKSLNGKKLFVPIPLLFFKLIISILWKLRIISVSPTSVNLIANGIVISPRKIIDKFSYTFKYSTKEAYIDAVKKRRERGTL